MLSCEENQGADRVEQGAGSRILQPPERFGSDQRKAQIMRSSCSFFRDINAFWCPKMVTIPAGAFVMGSPADEEGHCNSESPQHEVRISRPFALGRHPVTFDEFDHFCEQTGRMKPGDEDWGRGRRPAIYVPYGCAEAYCAWLSEMTGETYRLPSEAEWEYACRAGTTSAYAFGDELAREQANIKAGKTREVGAYRANAWGLCDMHGGVEEWCSDHWHPSYVGAPTDGRSWTSPPSPYRVLRGGAWIDNALGTRSAGRNYLDPNDGDDFTGFRCARCLA